MVELVAGAFVIGAVGAAAVGAAGAGSAWLLNRKIKKKRKKLAMRLFGLPLEILLPMHITGTGVPVIVEKTCDEIEKRGVYSEGILRIAASLNRVKELKQEFRRGTIDTVNLSEESIDNVAGLLKLFLKDLPEPLCPYDLNPRFGDVHRDYHQQDDKWLEEMLKLVAELPELNRRTFQRLFECLKKIVDHKDVNRMSPENVGIVMGPTLFKPRTDDPSEILKTTPLFSGLVSKMVIFYDRLFPLALVHQPLYVFPKKDKAKKKEKKALKKEKDKAKKMMKKSKKGKDVSDPDEEGGEATETTEDTSDDEFDYDTSDLDEDEDLNDPKYADIFSAVPSFASSQFYNTYFDLSPSSSGSSSSSSSPSSSPRLSGPTPPSRLSGSLGGSPVSAASPPSRGSMARIPPTAPPRNSLNRPMSYSSISASAGAPSSIPETSSSSSSSSLSSSASSSSVTGDFVPPSDFPRPGQPQRPVPPPKRNHN
eukprot:TRINITY_DN1538_c0_g1_i3.p1 TRINITY_DN1538_c0_g1~~TRINITY_DN1538_c0_g1_i3.p1  ORF type:complete len:480 (+),score=218.06 TRINITY_DN1538_c0_g1_i3:1390-2829(+)